MQSGGDTMARPQGRAPHADGLIGRESELGLLTRSIASLGLNIVRGEAGIGKTTLVRAAAAAAGATLFEAIALYPLRAVPGLPLRRATASLLPEDPVQAAGVLSVALAGRTLWLDNAQWADPFTASVAAILAQRAPVTVTVRTSGACNPSDAFGPARTTLELEALDDEAGAEVAVRSNPALSHEQACAITARAHGNPQLIVHLARDPDPGADLRRSVAGRMAELGVHARTALSALGLLGRAAHRRLLGEGVDELVAAGLAVDAGYGSIACSDQLLAEIGAGLLSADARRSLHARLARLVDDPAERARHHAAAGETAEAMAASLVAASRATTAAEKVAHFSFAAEHAPAPMAARLWQRAAAHAVGDDARRLAGRAEPRRPLSRRESQVMALVAEGCTSALVAVRLGLSPQTVESHVRSAITKTGARNRTEAAVLAVERHP